jgi:hypothetical protein
MAFTLTQQSSQDVEGVTGQTITYGGAVAAGSLLTVEIGIRDTTVISGVADNVNGAWTAGPNLSDGPSSTRSAIFYKINSTAGTPTVTITYAASPVSSIAQIQEWAPSNSNAVVDQQNTNANASGTSHSHGSITTTGAGLICTVVTFGASTTKTVASGFTELTHDGFRMYAQYKITTTGETTTATMTSGSSATSSAAILSFTDAVSATGAPRYQGFQMMMRNN